MHPPMGPFPGVKTQAGYADGQFWEIYVESTCLV